MTRRIVSRSGGPVSMVRPPPPPKPPKQDVDECYEALFVNQRIQAVELSIGVSEKPWTSCHVDIQPGGDAAAANAVVRVYAVTQAGRSLVKQGLVLASLGLNTCQRVVEVSGKGAVRWEVTIQAGGGPTVALAAMSAICFGTQPGASATDAGAWRVVATTTVRDAIPTVERVEGMRVLVLADGIVYQLGADLSTWTVADDRNPTGTITGQPKAWTGTAWAGATTIVIDTVQAGASQLLFFNATASVFAAQNGTQLIAFFSPTSSTGARLRFDKANTDATIDVVPPIGDTLAQPIQLLGPDASASSTGATNMKGSIVKITAGSGKAGAIGTGGNVGDILLQGNVSGGMSTLVMANADYDLSAAESKNTFLKPTGANTAVRAIRANAAPIAGARRILKNECTGFGVTFAFGTSAATATIAPGTTVLIVGNGTAAEIWATWT